MSFSQAARSHPYLGVHWVCVYTTIGQPCNLSPSDGRWTLVSIHPTKTIPVGTLRKIIRDIGLTPEEFLRLLRE